MIVRLEKLYFLVASGENSNGGATKKEKEEPNLGNSTALTNSTDNVTSTETGEDSTEQDEAGERMLGRHLQWSLAERENWVELREDLP